MFIVENWETVEKHREGSYNYIYLLLHKESLLVSVLPGLFSMQITYFFIKWDHIEHADLYLHKYFKK